jgi:GTPase SAR1 family protein
MAMQTTSPPANPFSTRFVQPAAGEYLFAAEGDLRQMLGRLHAGASWGQIIGPHGSGKTTLLHGLRHELEAAGKQIVLVQLHDGQRRLPATAAESAAWNESTVVVVDGYEQLSRWSRWRLKAACRRRGCGLLVTAHADVGLPLLHETRPSEALAQQLVARLMGSGGFYRDLSTPEPPAHADRDKSHPTPFIAAEDVSREFAASGGDIREMLFRLYDLFEQRSR